MAVLLLPLRWAMELGSPLVVRGGVPWALPRTATSGGLLSAVSRLEAQSRTVPLGDGAGEVAGDRAERTTRAVP